MEGILAMYSGECPCSFELLEISYFLFSAVQFLELEPQACSALIPNGVEHQSLQHSLSRASPHVLPLSSCTPCASPCLALIPCSLLFLPRALPSLPASAPGRVQAGFWKEILWINGNILLLFHIITLFVKHRLQRCSRCWTQSSKSIYISQSTLHYEQMGEEKKQ